MTLDEATEQAARAVCADCGTDPDEMLGWGHQLRIRGERERWRFVADDLGIRAQLVALQSVGVVSFT